MATKPRSNLTVSEASGLSGISEARIRKAIRERQIRSRKQGSHVFVSVGDTVLLTLFDELDVPLKNAQKQRLRMWIDRRPWEKIELQSLPLGSAIQVNFPDRARRVAQDATRYAESKNSVVVSDPDIKAGEPVIAGSRISVYALKGRLDRGDTIADLLTDFPHLSEASIDVAVRYARANPRRGRPTRTRHAG